MFNKCWYTHTRVHTHIQNYNSAGTMLPLSQDAFIEKTLPQGFAYPVPSPPSPAAGAEQHLEGRVLKVLYWDVYSWKTLDPVMLESRAAQPAPQLSDRPQSRAWRESSSQGTSCHLCRAPPHITLFPPTAGKRVRLGPASASDTAVPKLSEQLLPAGSGEQTSTVQTSPLHLPQGGQWLTSVHKQEDWTENSEPVAHQLWAVSHEPAWCRPRDQLQERKHQQ